MNVPKISSKTSLFLLLLVISTLTIIPYLGLTNFHTKGEPREAIVAVSMLPALRLTSTIGLLICAF